MSSRKTSNSARNYAIEQEDNQIDNYIVTGIPASSWSMNKKLLRGDFIHLNYELLCLAVVEGISAHSLPQKHARV